jgi:hypothetical protein
MMMLFAQYTVKYFYIIKIIIAFQNVNSLEQINAAI